MHEIRKSKDLEVEQIKLKFKIVPVVIILYLIIGLASAGAFVGGLALLQVPVTNTTNLIPLAIIVLIASGIAFILSILLLIFRTIGFKQSEVIVSNRRVYGKYGLYIIKKTFSYRLDEIDNIEIGDTLGAHSLALNFQQGKGPNSTTAVYYGNASIPVSGPNVLRFRCVENYQEVYDVLNSMLLSLKNQIDLQTDIEMSKVDAENRKAEAMEKMVGNIVGAPIASNSNETKIGYIEEIKQLKELYDSGAITKEEFETEKKEILDSNHK